MTNEELILGLVREIHDDQKDVVTSINELKIAQEQLKAEIAASRNGYAPHQVVSMLHWVEDRMRKEEQTNDGIKKAIINWVVPILLAALILGLTIMTK